MIPRLNLLVPVGLLAPILSAIPPLVSSHREAPAVTETPKVDGTDFYMFRSYEPGRDGFVTLVANYLPLQDPYGGPNYFALDPDAVYEIHIDNDGDSQEDITFQFRFRIDVEDISLSIGPPGQEKVVAVPLINVGPITSSSSGNQNRFETYIVDVISAGHRRPVVEVGTGNRIFNKPIDNIGQKSLPDYASYAAEFQYDIALPGGSVGRLFVGQRKDPFVVNLGETFDLINTNPLGPVNAEADDLADKNVTSLILEVPIDFLVDSEPVPDPVIGGWTTASVPQEKIEKAPAELRGPDAAERVQVSRLGMPLVNEVVVGLKDKDRFNASRPAADAQFLDYVTHPTLPALIESLFGVQAPTLFPRSDLVQVFLTGIPGLNQPANGVPAEMLRLNTSIAPTPKGSQSNLGVLGGDLAGFPNGRRPGDDVVDLALRVVMGVLLDTTVAPAGQLPYTDGAFVDDGFFDGSFPYLRTPIPGSPNGTP